MSVALALGVVALAARGIGAWSWTVPVAVGVVGVAAAPIRSRTSTTHTWVAVTAAASAMFVVASVSAGAMPMAGGGLAVVVSAAAAIGEELFFRRGLYGFLERTGAVLAIGVTSVLFAIVHVGVYGWRLAALDLAAGVVFGWQRWATGTWTSPAASHVVANVVAYL